MRNHRRPRCLGFLREAVCEDGEHSQQQRHEVPWAWAPRPSLAGTSHRCTSRLYSASTVSPSAPRCLHPKKASHRNDICPNFAGNYCRLLGLFLKQPLLIRRGSNSSGSTDQPAYCCNSSTNSFECKSLSSGTDFPRTELDAGVGIRFRAGSLHVLLRAVIAKALHCTGATKVLRPFL